jgi:hypothetical protein
MMRAGFKISIEWTGPDVGRLGDWGRDGEQSFQFIGREQGGREPLSAAFANRGHLAQLHGAQRASRGDGRGRVQERGQFAFEFHDALLDLVRHQPEFHVSRIQCSRVALAPSP